MFDISIVRLAGTNKLQGEGRPFGGWSAVAAARPMLEGELDEGGLCYREKRAISEGSPQLEREKYRKGAQRRRVRNKSRGVLGRLSISLLDERCFHRALA